MAERVGFEPTVPVRYDGFQDRSVMTTSVSLRKLLQYVIIMNGLCQVIFLIFYGRRCRFTIDVRPKTKKDRKKRLSSLEYSYHTTI